MISYRQALYEIKSLASLKVSCIIPTLESYGHICREDIFCQIDLPNFESSSVDGFAICSKETTEATPMHPKYFNVCGTLIPGTCNINTKRHDSTSVWEVATGAMLPLEYDAIEKIEDVTVFRDNSGKINKIAVTAPVLKGKYIRTIGEDFTKNALVISKGTRVGSKHIMALTYFGRSNIEVSQTPKATIICTGSELESHNNEHLETGKIYNCVGPYLINELTRMGAKTTYLGMVEDNEQVFLRIVEKAIGENPDLVITTGGVSEGRFDFVPKCMEQIGVEKCFHKASVQPGKSIFVGKLHNTTFFSLPGNPISAVVGVRFFIDPFLRYLTGEMEEKPLLLPLAYDTQKPKELCSFFRGKIDNDNGFTKVTVFEAQASFMINSYLKANCWVVLNSSAEKISKNTLVETVPLNSYCGFDL